MSPSSSSNLDSSDTSDYRSSRFTKPLDVFVEFGGQTHPGLVRANNEDHYLVASLAKAMNIRKTSLPDSETVRFASEEGFLYIVADGMGGVAGGEEASSVAVQTVESFVLNTLKWFLHLGEKDQNSLLEELREGMRKADESVMRRAWSDASLAGMGTTLTMGFGVGASLFIVHAGDSRAYLFRDDELSRITCDHTLVQLLIDGGMLTPEAAKHHNRRNVVTNVVGGPRPGVHAEIHKVPISDGDVILLCTDGLTEPVEESQIARILGRDASPDELCELLIAEALEAGGPDNVTAVIARYHLQ